MLIDDIFLIIYFLFQNKKPVDTQATAAAATVAVEETNNKNIKGVKALKQKKKRSFLCFR